MTKNMVTRLKKYARQCGFVDTPEPNTLQQGPYAARFNEDSVVFLNDNEYATVAIVADSAREEFRRAGLATGFLKPGQRVG